MSDALELATRALKHFNEGTTDLAPSQMRIPLTAYTDEHGLSGPSPTHAYAAAPPLEKSILDRTNIPLCPYSDSTDILR